MLLTDTIPTPGWWLIEHTGRRIAQPAPGYILWSDVEGLKIHEYTNDPDRVLEWVGQR